MSGGKVVTLDDGFRVYDIDCSCGTHSQITSEDVFSHSCSCGKLYFNLAYYYYFDKDGTACFNEHYKKIKNI